MKKWLHLAMMIGLVFLLSGCWDQRFFKEVKLALTSSFDLAPNGKLITTASLPNIEKSTSGPGLETVQIISVEANTPRQSRVKLDRKISKTFDSSKMRVLLFGDKLARKGIYSLLDVFYRDPTSALNMNLGVVKGKAGDAIRLRTTGETKPSEYLSGLLRSAARSTLIGQEENIQGIAGKMLDPGLDVALPYLIVDKRRGVVDVNGLALFNGDKYSGVHLNSSDSTLFLIMNGELGQITRLTERIKKHETNDFMSYLTLEVKSEKNHRKVTIDKNGKISVSLYTQLKVQVIEYPKDKLNHSRTVRYLNEKLSKRLTQQAVGIVKQLQKADCDGFGIGRRIMAFHRTAWEHYDWNKTYPHITIKPEVKVNIIQHGIVD